MFGGQDVRNNNIDSNIKRINYKNLYFCIFLKRFPTLSIKDKFDSIPSSLTMPSCPSDE